MDGSSIPYPYGHGFGFPDLRLFQQSAHHNGKCGARVQDRFVNLITYFDGVPGNRIFTLGAAPLSLFRDLHFRPGSLQALRVPVDLALLGVIVLVGAASAGNGAESPFFTWLLTLRCGGGCSSPTSGGG